MQKQIKVNRQEVPLTQQYLYSLIQQTSQASSHFLLGYKNKFSNEQLSKLYRQAKTSISELLKKAKTLVQHKLQFLQEFHSLLDEVKCLQVIFYEKIQLVAKGNSDNLSRARDRDQIHKSIQKVVQQADRVLMKAKFLLKKWDIEFYAQLHEEGVTNQTIIRMRDQNIRKKFLNSFSDELFNEIGIRTMGDKIILKSLIGKK